MPSEENTSPVPLPRLPIEASAVYTASTLATESSLPSRGFNRYFLRPRFLATRLLLHPCSAALNQNHQNDDRQSSCNNSDNRRLIHAIFLFLLQLLG
jgi:hypothetical protein